jgi:hypothetical protein
VEQLTENWPLGAWIDLHDTPPDLVAQHLEHAIAVGRALGSFRTSSLVYWCLSDS